MREPSLGPVFSNRGGATGGGHAQIVPMEDINLHFTGDIHAICAANNLVVALLDNHIFQQNLLKIDPKKIIWKRCTDMNDRQLRKIYSGMGGRGNGVLREDAFEIASATETMAVLCLSKSLQDLKERLSKMIVAYSVTDKAITVHDLKAEGAMAALLKDGIMPNLVQTLEHTPVLVHGGPVADISHGCNSIITTQTALKLADYVISEASVSSDIGLEKFFNIKCRVGGFTPDAVVMVTTISDLKHHGAGKSLHEKSSDTLDAGLPHLAQHISNLRSAFGMGCVVCLNQFADDREADIKAVQFYCRQMGISMVCSKAWAKGSRGAMALANEVVSLCEKPDDFHFSYSLEAPIEEKIMSLAKEIYHGDGISLSRHAHKQIKQLTAKGYDKLPICVAKTQYSFSDNGKLKGVPNGFQLHIRNIRLCAGAGFLVAITGEILVMPSLPDCPGVRNIDIDATGKITGLI